MYRYLAIAVVALGCTAESTPADAATRQSTGKEYRIDVSLAPQSPKAGEGTRVLITITPEAPYVLKTTTPMKIQLECTEGCSLDKAKLTAKDIADPESKAKAVTTQLTAKSGKHRLDGDLSFFLCTDEICARKTDDLTVAFEAL